jgi:hypothetical protein
MSNLKTNRGPIVVSVIVLSLITLPYILANQVDGAEAVFSGFLFNPLDGNSYLAKMYQGWLGSWRFQLPFTAEPGDGAYLFLFYLFLGHLARMLGLSILAVFHTTRILGSIVLLVSLWRFFSTLIKPAHTRNLAFGLAALGSGLGWLLIPLGSFTADFWVAETYPFLSMYANPHFPVGLALVLGLVTPAKTEKISWRRIIQTGSYALFLSVINPFGVVIVLMVLGGNLVVAWISKNKWKPLARKLMVSLFFGLPILFYDYWVAYSDPVFQSWNAQNFTPSPPVWDVIVALSPVLILALIGGPSLWKRNAVSNNQPVTRLAIWGVLGLILLYMPFSLQRRFMLGLYIPLSGLAALGIEAIAKDKLDRFKMLSIGTYVVALPTNLVILLAAFSGIQSQDQQIFLSRAEQAAFTWILTNTHQDAVILTSPEMGLFIPAHTGRRVVYGHPFESVDAAATEKMVLDFYTGEKVSSILASQMIDYVIWGDRENEIGDYRPHLGMNLVYDQDDLKIFQVEVP